MENTSPKKSHTGLIVSIIILVAIIVLGYMYGHKGDSMTDETTVGIQDQATTPNTEVQDTKTPASTKPMDSNKRLLQNFIPVSNIQSLEKTDLVVGTGAVVKPGDTVSVHYTGAVAATGEVFQSSKDFGTDPITFPLSGVIKGWTDGIPGMKVGGTRRLVIPANQAYGANPPPNSGIPANAALVFDVELIAIK